MWYIKADIFLKLSPDKTSDSPQRVKSPFVQIDRSLVTTFMYPTYIIQAHNEMSVGGPCPNAVCVDWAFWPIDLVVKAVPWWGPHADSNLLLGTVRSLNGTSFMGATRCTCKSYGQCVLFWPSSLIYIKLAYFKDKSFEINMGVVVPSLHMFACHVSFQGQSYCVICCVHGNHFVMVM